MRLILGYQDTRENQEDIALTPYLFGVFSIKSIVKIYGIGLCWFYFSFYIGIGFNIPKECVLKNHIII
jgi:hypothetical protein